MRDKAVLNDAGNKGMRDKVVLVRRACMRDKS